MILFNNIQNPKIKKWLTPNKKKQNSFLQALSSGNKKSLDIIFKTCQTEGINPFHYTSSTLCQGSPVFHIIKLVNKLSNNTREISDWMNYLYNNGFNLLDKNISVLEENLYTQGESISEQTSDEYYHFYDLLCFSKKGIYSEYYKSKESPSFLNVFLTKEMISKFMTLTNDTVLLKTINSAYSHFHGFSHDINKEIKYLFSDMCRNDSFSDTLFELPFIIIQSLEKDESHLLKYSLLSDSDIFNKPINILEELNKQIKNKTFSSRTIEYFRHKFEQNDLSNSFFTSHKKNYNIITEMYEFGIPLSFINDYLVCPAVLNRKITQKNIFQKSEELVKQNSKLEFALHFINYYNYKSFENWLTLILDFNHKHSQKIQFSHDNCLSGENYVKFLMYFSHFEEEHNDKITFEQLLSELNIRTEHKNNHSGFFEVIQYQRHLLSHDDSSVSVNTVENLLEYLSEKDIVTYLPQIKKDYFNNNVVMRNNQKEKIFAKTGLFLEKCPDNEIKKFIKNLSHEQIMQILLPNRELSQKILSSGILHPFKDIYSPDFLCQTFAGKRYSEWNNMEHNQLMSSCLYSLTHADFSDYQKNHSISSKFAHDFLNEIVEIKDLNNKTVISCIEKAILNVSFVNKNIEKNPTIKRL